jgi:hypothetical protein
MTVLTQVDIQALEFLDETAPAWRRLVPAIPHPCDDLDSASPDLYVEEHEKRVESEDARITFLGTELPCRRPTNASRMIQARPEPRTGGPMLAR